MLDRETNRRVVIVLVGFPMLATGLIRHDRSFGDHLEYAEEAQFDPVLRVVGEGDRIASGVLIAPRWVLTAGHVARPRTPLRVERSDDGWGIAEVVVHPRYAGSSEAGVDLALLRLNRPVTQVRPAVIIEPGVADVGEEAALVGFGARGKALDEASEWLARGRKMAGRNVIDSAMAPALPGGLPAQRWSHLDSLYLAWDFDHPDEASASRLGSAVPLSLEYQIARGDSGGALFVASGKDWYLAGIVVSSMYSESSAWGYYGGMGFAVRLSRQLSWIDGVVGEREEAPPNTRLLLSRKGLEARACGARSASLPCSRSASR